MPWIWIGCWDDRRIAFSQNSSRGRREEEALTSFNQPCRARPSPVDPAGPAGPAARARASQQPEEANPNLQPPNLQQGSGQARETDTESEGPCHPGPPDSLAAQVSWWSVSLSGPRFSPSQQGSRQPRRLGSSPAGAPTSGAHRPGTARRANRQTGSMALREESSSSSSSGGEGGRGGGRP